MIGMITLKSHFFLNIPENENRSIAQHYFGIGLSSKKEKKEENHYEKLTKYSQ